AFRAAMGPVPHEGGGGARSRDGARAALDARGAARRDLRPGAEDARAGVGREGQRGARGASLTRLRRRHDRPRTIHAGAAVTSTQLFAVQVNCPPWQLQSEGPGGPPARRSLRAFRLTTVCFWSARRPSRAAVGVTGFGVMSRFFMMAPRRLEARPD